jgi:hypothetical protein
MKASSVSVYGAANGDTAQASCSCPGAMIGHEPEYAHCAYEPLADVRQDWTHIHRWIKTKSTGHTY